MRRSLLAVLLLASTLLLALLSFQSKPLPLPEAAVVLNTPYADEPSLGAYNELFKAGLHGNVAAQRRYVETDGEGFLLYRTLLDLARNPRLPARERLHNLERVLAFGLVSPLARDDRRRAQLELAGLAERANAKRKAVAAYLEALPLDAAAAGLRRLEHRPRVLARLFLEAREPELALQALQGVSAPALRAPALAARSDDLHALAAYNRWLSREPNEGEALEGKVFVLIALTRFSEARTLLDTLPVSPELEVALAEAQGDDATRLTAYRSLAHTALSGETRDEARWRVTELLEKNGELAAALPLYLELAGGTSDFQDDAAYRAYTLARRLGNSAAATRADTLLPRTSYFSLLRGRQFASPRGSLARRELPVLALVEVLERAGDREAALGELLIALKRSQTEAATVTLAEALQERGEYGASSEAARAWLERGSLARRTYRAAYPRAYAAAVRAEARARGVEPAFVWAVMRQESHFYPRAVSTSAAQGLLQVVPSTWSYLAELLGEPPAQPFAPRSNIRYGTFYLSRLLASFGGDLPQSAAAYNGGPGYIGRLLDEPQIAGRDDFLRAIGRSETREYVQRVMYNVAVYRALYGRENP